MRTEIKNKIQEYKKKIKAAKTDKELEEVVTEIYYDGYNEGADDFQE